LIAVILRDIKTIGEKVSGQEIEKILLGRPVFFSDDATIDKMAEGRLAKAAKLAGFKEINFQLEPIAAGLSYERSLPDKKERKVLVGDFGGGTSDFTVMRLGQSLTQKTDRKGDVLSLGGVYVAGDSFDSAIMMHRIAKYYGAEAKYQVPLSDQWHGMPGWLISLLKKWHLILLLREKKVKVFLSQIKTTTDDRAAIENLISLIEDNYGFLLFRTIEKAKIRLSTQEEAKIRFRERNLVIEERTTKKEFDFIISEEVHRIEKSVEETLLLAGLATKDISNVFLTGGSSFVPRIRRIFVDKFGAEKITQKDAFTSVVEGLGISSSLFF
jgi:hypothetical chaperone protein